MGSRRVLDDGGNQCRVRTGGILDTVKFRILVEDGTEFAPAYRFRVPGLNAPQRLGNRAGRRQAGVRGRMQLEQGPNFVGFPNLARAGLANMYPAVGNPLHETNFFELDECLAQGVPLG